jgi:hypothetical protein
MDCVATDYLVQDREARVKQVTTPQKYPCAIVCTTELSKTSVEYPPAELRERERERKTVDKPVD